MTPTKPHHRCPTAFLVDTGASRTVDRKGKPVLIKLKGKVEPFYR